MATYKIGNAIVRIHGEIDQEKLKESTTIFIKKVITRKEKNGDGNKNTSRAIGKK